MGHSLATWPTAPQRKHSFFFFAAAGCALLLLFALTLDMVRSWCRCTFLGRRASAVVSLDGDAAAAAARPPARARRSAFAWRRASRRAFLTSVSASTAPSTSLLSSESEASEALLSVDSVPESSSYNNPPID